MENGERTEEPEVGTVAGKTGKWSKKGWAPGNVTDREDALVEGTRSEGNPESTVEGRNLRQGWWGKVFSNSEH